MIFVVELYRQGPNVFKTGANFITHDHPDPDRLGVTIFWTLDEVRAAHQRGASIFADFGPVGYTAFAKFEEYLQEQNIIPKPQGAKPKKSKKPRHKPDWAG